MALDQPAVVARPRQPLRPPPLENDDLLEAYERCGAPQLRVYEPHRRVIVLGASGSAAADVREAAARAAAIPVRRRRGGGGTVLLTPGQVVVALVTAVAHPYRSRAYAHAINGWLRAALERAGVRGVAPRGISDLAIGERKIAGTSVFRRRLILFYQASVLVANDPAEFERYLTYPAQEPDYRSGRGHQAFCTTLHAAGFPLPVAAVRDLLQAEVAARLPCAEPRGLSDTSLDNPQPLERFARYVEHAVQGDCR